MSNLKLKLKKIDPVKYALITGTALAGVTFVIFAFFTLIGSLFGAAMGEFGPFAAIAGSGIVMLIVGPILYFIFGFIFGLIGAFLLNFILSKTDGLIIDFEKIGESDDLSMIGRGE
ncbi:hypothetical protein [Tenacibaculum sp. 190524A05c]|uniref:hypothetical protein n=1 Tax=Tenacibaculum platacis TaxID=3137852 RepID=UPI0032B165B5